MTRRRWTSFLLVLLLLGLTIATHHVQSGLTEKRTALTDAPPLENAPPGLALAVVVLGGFRGLLADLLFLRSSKMQERGNYFELVQLARWTVQLQPRFTAATSFSSWNLAYNVSVNFSQPEERWRWVSAGIELIRDHALPMHPGDPKLYHQLGWTYQHKVGQNLDDMHYYYKQQLALEMIQMAGVGPYNWYALGQAPRTSDQLLAALGEDAAAFHAALAKDGLSLIGLEQHFRHTGALSPGVTRFAERHQRDLLLDHFLRTRWLLERNLDAAIIAEVDSQYGPLDFRTAQAHAIYWAYQGLRHTQDESMIHLECERMIFQSLARSTEIGRVTYLPHLKAKVHLAPNLDIVDRVRDAYLRSIDNHPSNRGIRSGFENFMVDTIRNLYIWNREQKAQEYLQHMRDSKHWAGHARYLKTLNRFVVDELGEDISDGGQHQAFSIIQSMLVAAYHNIGLQRLDAANGYERLARGAYAKYHENIKSERDQGRRGLPPYRQMKQQTLNQLARLNPPVYEIVRREIEQLHEQEADGEQNEQDQPESSHRNLLDGIEPGDELPVQRN